MSRNPRWDHGTGCRRRSGFTLIEALIVVAVIAVLAAIAVPMYQDSVRNARRADAVAALTAVQQAQERWRGNHAAYTTELTAAPTASPPGLGLPALSPSGHYTIAIDTATATGYTVVATAVAGGSQAADAGCQRLRVRVDGGNIFHGAAGLAGAFDESAGNRCWRR
jgi:type IV pilus assembly protein PilE